jgi:hypothetical protein
VYSPKRQGSGWRFYSLSDTRAFPPIRQVERRRLRCVCRRRCSLCRWACRGCGRSLSAATSTARRRTATSDARGRDGGVREELAAGVILVCAANCPIGENNSSLEMARVDERTLNALRILALSYPRKRHRPAYWVTSSASPNGRDFAER